MLGIEAFYLFIDQLSSERIISYEEATRLKSKAEKVFDGLLEANHDQARIIFESHEGFFQRFQAYVVKKGGASV